MKKVILFLILMLIPTSVLGYSSSATSAIVMDTDNNRIIYSSNIHKVRSVASISKIMTAILAVESNKLDDVVVIGDEITGSYGSGVYISVGEKITLRDLVYGLMLRSGNDAALAIANYVGGSVDNFVKMMNEKALSIGMKDSTFNNPSGLDSPTKLGNYSSAYDMAVLTSYAMDNKTYREITKTKVHTVKTNMNTYSWTNKNKLLNSYKYATGGKTGFTEIARRTLVTTASKDDVNLVTVTLNDGNDFSDHKALFEEAFKEYKNYKILKKGYVDIVDEKYYSNRKFYIKKNFNYILNESEKDSILLKFNLDRKYTYKIGDRIGEVVVYVGDKEVYKTDVYIELKKKKIKVIEMILGWFK
jgi:D-alanyl-D-alanine carboxypeptidase